MSDLSLLKESTMQWEERLSTYRLPKWEEIPDFGLYMEQVIVLMKQYFDIFPEEMIEEQIITASAINNYVRTKVMPKPEKKKYYRIHIAYIIMICTLKQSLSISLFQKLLPIGVDEETVRKMYESYSERFTYTTTYFRQQVEDITGNLMKSSEDNDIETMRNEAIVSAAIMSGLAKVFAEQLAAFESTQEK